MKNELYHYGSLGMRWGLRRYQNYDGSLTEEGKQRYGKNIEKHYGKARKKLNKYKNKQLKSENKALKYDKKSLKQIEKAEKYAEKKLRGKASDSNVAIRLAKYDRMREKADFYENTSFGWKDKAETYKQKGENWAEKMDEVFEKIDVRNIPKSDIESGKAYVNYIDMLQLRSKAESNLEVANMEYLEKLDAANEELENINEYLRRSRQR